MISEAFEYVVAQLTAAGVAATADPRDLSLPGILVGLHSATRNLDGSAEVRVRLLAVAPDNGAPARHLDDLLDAVWVVGLVDAEAVAITLPNHSPAPLPALELFTTVTVTKE